MNLFEWAERGSRHTDPNTSREAAYRDLPRKGTDRWIALKFHAAHHRTGLTDFELGELMDRQQTSAGKRRGELRDMGFVEATEVRRAAPSGSAAVVWRITADALRVLSGKLNAR